MPAHHGYPAARERPTGAAPQLGAKYERYEASGAVTLTDTLADVFTFGGRPDTIAVSVRAFPALVVLTDRMNREADRILVPVDSTVEFHISRERVRALNAIAASNAIISVVGKWAERDGD